MTFDPEQVVSNLTRAVEIEVRAILADAAGSARKVPLKDGRFLGSTDDGRQYEFACGQWPDEFVGQALLIRRTRSRAPWQPVLVEQFSKNRARVVSQGDLGPRLESFQLRLDESASWTAVTDRLQAVAEQPAVYDRDRAGRIFDVGGARALQIGDLGALVPGWLDDGPNPAQQAAVARSLAAETTFIWGPPGTGKTELVSRVVEGSWRQGLTVLFVAPTRVAVDQATQRICALLEHEADFAAGLVQRLGTIDSQDLKSTYGDFVDPSRIVDRLQTGLLAAVASLEVDLAQCTSGIAVHDAHAAASDELADLAVERAKLMAVGASARADALDAKLAKLRAAAGEKMKQDASRWARRAQEKYEQLVGSVDYQVVVRSRQSLMELDRRLVRVQSTLTAMQKEFEGLPPRDALVDRKGAAEAGIGRLRGKIAEVSARVTSSRRVLCTTVSRAVLSNIWHERFDVVVIDEAGMVDLPHAWLVAGLAKSRLVVAGDFRQLPPVTRGSSSQLVSLEDRRHASSWLDQDAFRSAGLVGVDGRVKADDRLVSLDTQYRMRTPICRVVNHVAYPDSPLRTGRKEESHLISSELLAHPVTLIDTSGVRIPMSPRPGAHLTNAVHVAAVNELVRGLQYGGLLPARKDVTGAEPASVMAVIAPFNAQVTAMRRSLNYRFGREVTGVVDTIHRFQGSERNLVVFDTVAGAGAKPGYFYEGTGLGSTACRLLNVALSRARDHLVVVADVDYLESSLPLGTPARQMLLALEENSARLPIEQLVPTRSGRELHELSDEELRRPAFFPADEVALAVVFDLERAQRTVDIYCAFLAPSGLRRWRVPLQKCLARGIVVTVFTRQQEQESSGSTVANELAALGCRLETRDRMHEKVLIVDDEILWHGSLNLLAHDGPTDLMMRLLDEESCKEVRRIVERAQMERPARSYPRSSSTSRRVAGGPTPGEVVDGRRYLLVPFEEKDEAKRLVDARWDGSCGLWHVSEEVALERIKRWLPPLV